MDDATARREARRIRILKKSEYRLQKIRGMYSVDKTLEKKDIPTSKQNTHSILSCSKLNSIHDNVINKNRNIQEGTYQNLPPTMDDCLGSSSFVLRYEPPSPKWNKPEITEQSNMHILFTNKLVYTVLAVVINLMMIFQFDNIYGKSIITPFLVVFLTRFYFVGAVFQSTEGNFLFAALVLCNIEPIILYTYKKVFNTITFFIQDFALYIFSFVIFFNMITKYFIDFDDSLPETIQALDSQA